jgi:hypothetical protein
MSPECNTGKYHNDCDMEDCSCPHHTEQWKVTREADDPQALRLSIGGVEGELGYIVYRGDTKKCLNLLKRAVSKLEEHYTDQGE